MSLCHRFARVQFSLHWLKHHQPFLDLRTLWAILDKLHFEGENNVAFVWMEGWKGEKKRHWWYNIAVTFIQLQPRKAHWNTVCDTGPKCLPCLFLSHIWTRLCFFYRQKQALSKFDTYSVYSVVRLLTLHLINPICGQRVSARQCSLFHGAAQLCTEHPQRH